MAQKQPPKGTDDQERISFAVSSEERPDFKESLSAYAFTERGDLIDSSSVRGGKVSLKIEGRRTRVFLGPTAPKEEEPTLALMKRVQAFEPVLRPGLTGSIVDSVRIPGDLLDFWPLCFCLVRGRVVRNIGGRDYPVCGARVHLCEVDRIPNWILTLPDPDILRLRDDLIEVITHPPLPRPKLPPIPGPRPPMRFARDLADTRPDPPGLRADSAERQAVAGEGGPELSTAARSALNSTSTTVVRQALIDNVALILPYLCLWPHWWRFRCDEFAVVTTDAFGRFQTWLRYPCLGDRPDIYLWVEYQIGGSWEVVYRPPIPCFTYWNHACGTEITVRVTDTRVPVCGDDELLTGCQVAVLSIGNNVSIREVETAGANEGLTTSGQPFGGDLEPHVWFGRQCLFSKNITKYRWSYRKAGAIGWTVMDREVGRHYVVIDPVTSDLSFPFEGLGPDPANLFRIKPISPPAPGLEWFVVNARTDTATAFFETNALAGGNTETAAGRYEIKLELFKANGALVDWTAEGIALRIPEVGETAPFAPDTLETEDAPGYYRIIDPGNGHTMGFQMVVHVDNNPCSADVFAITGVGLSVDPTCGFIHYTPGASATVSFEAHHPNGFATFGFNVTRGLNGAATVADSGGKVGNSPLNGYTLTGTNPHRYEKTIPVPALLDSCPSAAFSEVVDVDAMATDGWKRLSGYDAGDSAAFALDVPCPPCECDD